MTEDKKIKEAETEPVQTDNVLTAEEIEEKNKKVDFYIELALFLILGLLVGIAVKTEASKKITIGFNDYQMKISRQDYNINNLQANLAKKAADAADNANASGQNSLQDGGSCSINQ